MAIGILHHRSCYIVPKRHQLAVWQSSSVRAERRATIGLLASSKEFRGLPSQCLSYKQTSRRSIFPAWLCSRGENNKLARSFLDFWISITRWTVCQPLPLIPFDRIRELTSSNVSFTKKRIVVTSFFWPILCIRANACSSIVGFLFLTSTRPPSPS